MLPFKLVYHRRYDLDLGPHVFPSQKFKMVHDALLAEGLADESDFIEPEPAHDEDVLRVHTPEWVQKLHTDSLTLSERMKLEIPFSNATVEAFWLAAGGSTLAGRLALKDGFAANLGGGFHHAYPGHGEGFCMIHDVAIAIRALQASKAIRTAMTVDTDVHHGNGTAAIFANDASVYTFSIHQENNYPMPKPPSDEDIGLDDGVRDTEYLEALEEGLVHSLKRMTPDLIFLSRRGRSVSRGPARGAGADLGRPPEAGSARVRARVPARDSCGVHFGRRVRKTRDRHRAHSHQYDRRCPRRGSGAPPGPGAVTPRASASLRLRAPKCVQSLDYCFWAALPDALAMASATVFTKPSGAKPCAR
jgi:hypothetical protein